MPDFLGSRREPGENISKRNHLECVWVNLLSHRKQTNQMFLPFEQVGYSYWCVGPRKTNATAQCIVCFLLSSRLKGSWMYKSQIWNLCTCGIKTNKNHFLLVLRRWASAASAATSCQRGVLVLCNSPADFLHRSKASPVKAGLVTAFFHVILDKRVFCFSSLSASQINNQLSLLKCPRARHWHTFCRALCKQWLQ